jgi:hypothetical protein
VSNASPLALSKSLAPCGRGSVWSLVDSVTSGGRGRVVEFSTRMLGGLEDSFVLFSVLLSEGVMSKDCLIALKFYGCYLYMN